MRVEPTDQVQGLPATHRVLVLDGLDLSPGMCPTSSVNHDIAARRGPGLVRLITVTQERSFKIAKEALNVAVFPRRRIVEYDLVVLAEDRPEVRLAHLPGAGRPALIVVSSIAITELERTEAHCASKIGFKVIVNKVFHMHG